MNSKNSKKSDSHRVLVIVKEEINLKRSDKHVALLNLSIHYIWINLKRSYRNNKFEISAPM